MKHNHLFNIAFTVCGLGLPAMLAAQNIGILNETPATRAKLEVPGVYSGGATSALFGGDGAGISIQRNWPTIGFNQFRDDVTPGSQGKYMAGGPAALWYFSPTSGQLCLDMFPIGTANAYTPAPPALRALTINNLGDWSIRSNNFDATLNVGRGDGIDGTAVFVGQQGLASHINYSGSEDTYIRSGLDTGKVFISTDTGGDTFIGGGNQRVGINTLGVIPSATLHINQRNITGQTFYHALSLGQNLNSNPASTLYRWSMRSDYSSATLNNTLWLFYNGTSKGRFIYNTGVYSPPSDRRLKTNITELEPVLSNVKLLQPVTYAMKTDDHSTERQIGFIAQDVEALFPLLVRTIDNNQTKGDRITDMRTMNYSGFGVIAIKALQEQHAQIQALEKELDELLAELEKEISKK
jgi:Chaperone of endosialidase